MFFWKIYFSKNVCLLHVYVDWEFAALKKGIFLSKIL